MLYNKRIKRICEAPRPETPGYDITQPSDILKYISKEYLEKYGRGGR